MTFVWQTQDVFYFSAGGVQLEGRCLGPSPDQANTFILLHEGLGSVALWRDFPSMLAKRTGWGVFVYSRQGYGVSDPVSLPRPLNYMNIEATENLPQVLDVIGLGNGVLLGHSDGASIAAIYAGSFKDPRVGGVILMAPHFFAEPVSIQSIEDAKFSYQNNALKDRLAKYHQDVEGAFLGWSDAWLHPDFLKWNIEERLPSIQVPVLALQGKEDQYATLKQMDALRVGIKTPLYIHAFEDCGHSPHLEQAEKSLAVIEKYVSEL